MELMLAFMCADRCVRQLRGAVEREHAAQVAAAACAIERERRGGGGNDDTNDDLLKATVAVLHASCREGHRVGQCRVTMEFEKEVLKYWTERFADADADAASSSEFDEEARREKALRRELDGAKRRRDDAGYMLVQRFFARAHLKRCVLGPDELDPAERLLCDFRSMNELRISSDTERLFEHAVVWLKTRHANQCRGCGRRDWKGVRRPIRCAACKMRCFCSVECQVRDESNRLFCHAHECGLLPLATTTTE